MRLVSPFPVIQGKERLGVDRMGPFVIHVPGVLSLKKVVLVCPRVFIL